MTLDLLDLLLVSHFCFNAEVPTWLWVLGALACLGNLNVLSKITEK